MPIFIDLMYPDNENRKKRLEELSNDCNHYMAQASEAYDKIKDAVEKTNEKIKEAFLKIGKIPPEMKKIDVTDDTMLLVSEIVAGALAIPASRCAMKWAFTSYLLRKGSITEEEVLEIGAAQLIKLNFPKYIRIGSEIGAAIVIALAFEAIIDSVDGAIQREELRDGIKEMIPLRVNMKKIDMINQETLILCTSVVMTYEAVSKLPTTTEEQLVQLAQYLIDQSKAKVELITDEKARAELEKEDSYRKSWTKEDGSTDAVLYSGEDVEELKVLDDEEEARFRAGKALGDCIGMEAVNML